MPQDAPLANRAGYPTTHNALEAGVWQCQRNSRTLDDMDTQTITLNNLETYAAVMHAAAYLIPAAIFLAAAVYHLTIYRKN